MTTPPKPPTDALPDVKALCERLREMLRVNALPGEDHMTEGEIEAVTDAVTTLERLNGLHAVLNAAALHEEIAQLETSLRSSEAALAEVRRERDNATEELADTFSQLKHSRRAMADRHEWEKSLNEVYDKMRAELTALRANAGEDSRRLDWLDAQRQDIVQRDSNGDPELLGYGWGLQEQANDVRTAIDMEIERAAMSATTPPASLASGGEGTL